MSEISSTFRMTLMGLLIVSGAINTIAYKFQNTQYVYEGGYYKQFFHPYMQATTMFFGQFLALFVYIAMKKRDPESFKMRMLQAKSKGLKLQMNKFLLAIPALSDFITSTLQYVALNFISGSVYQMLRGGAIVTTFIFSIIFLKIKVKRCQIAGAAMALFGVIVVGISNVAFKQHSGDSNQDTGLQIVGYILIILSLFTNGFLFVFQQKLLSQYHLEPLQVVGYQGAFGLGIQIILLPIMTFIPCSFGQSACVFNDRSMPYMERPESYFAAIFSNGALLFFVILGIFSIATFNIAGVSVTKYINALARSIGDVTRTVLVWMVGIIVTVTAGATHPNFVWEIVGAGAILVQLLGFLILVSGNLIYNQVIKLKFLQRDQKINPLLQSQSDIITSTNTRNNQSQVSQG